MKLLYKLGVFLYWMLIHVVALFNKKAKLFVGGRKNWEEILQHKIDKNGRYVWFHCASLGEFEQGRPVIEEVKEKFPEYKIILTFFSPSGYEIRKNYREVDVVSYLPIDTKKNAKVFLDIVKPEKIFFIKYEFWYYFITEAKNRQIPLLIVSAIFRDDQQFFKQGFAGKWFREILRGIDYFFVQNEKSAKLLAQIGFKNVTVSGDTRFDRVSAIAASVGNIPLVEKFKNGKPLVVVGSSWKADEELVIRFINQSEGVKYIIAPHEVTISNINRIKGDLKKSYIVYSELNDRNAENTDVLIIDSIGLLSSMYQFGEIAYIGGGFGVGIHNILEASTFGLPVLFGPNYKKFNEACDLIDIGGAFCISNYKDLERNLFGLLQNCRKLRQVSGLTINYIDHNVGASQKIVKKAFGL